MKVLDFDSTQDALAQLRRDFLSGLGDGHGPTIGREIALSAFFGALDAAQHALHAGAFTVRPRRSPEAVRRDLLALLAAVVGDELGEGEFLNVAEDIMALLWDDLKPSPLEAAAHLEALVDRGSAVGADAVRAALASLPRGAEPSTPAEAVARDVREALEDLGACS